MIPALAFLATLLAPFGGTAPPAATPAIEFGRPDGPPSPLAIQDFKTSFDFSAVDLVLPETLESREGEEDEPGSKVAWSDSIAPDASPLMASSRGSRPPNRRIAGFGPLVRSPHLRC